MADQKYRERKFILAILFTASGIAGLFYGKISGQEFYWLAGMVLSGYGINKIVETPPWEK